MITYWRDDSPLSLASIQNEIEKLEPAERAALIDVLWESLTKSGAKRSKQNGPPNLKIASTLSSEVNCLVSMGPSVLEELRSSLTK